MLESDDFSCSVLVACEYSRLSSNRSRPLGACRTKGYKIKLNFFAFLMIMFVYKFENCGIRFFLGGTAKRSSKFCKQTPSEAEKMSVTEAEHLCK